MRFLSRASHCLCSPRNREYFFYITERGHLFNVSDPVALVQGTRVPSGPTHLKDPKFLNFFYSRLTSTPPESPYYKFFPFLSECRGELNYLRAQDTAIVFHDLVDAKDLPNVVDAPVTRNKTAYANSRVPRNDSHLIYAGNKRVKFDPGSVVISREGRFYHPAPVGLMGLLETHLASREIGEHLAEIRGGYEFRHKGVPHTIGVWDRNPGESCAMNPFALGGSPDPAIELQITSALKRCDSRLNHRQGLAAATRQPRRALDFDGSGRNASMFMNSIKDLEEREFGPAARSTYLGRSKLRDVQNNETLHPHHNAP